MRFHARILMAALLLPLAGAVAGPKDGSVNLLENGDFEADAPGGGILPAGWKMYMGVKDALEIAGENSPDSPGKQCLRLSPNDQVKTVGLCSGTIPCDPSRSLTISAWIRSGDAGPGAPSLAVAWYDGAKKPIIMREGTKVNYTYVPIKRTVVWAQYKWTFEPTGSPPYKNLPPNAAFCVVQIFSSFPTCFDDLILRQD